MFVLVGRLAATYRNFSVITFLGHGRTTTHGALFSTPLMSARPVSIGSGTTRSTSIEKSRRLSLCRVASAGRGASAGAGEGRGKSTARTYSAGSKTPLSPTLVPPIRPINIVPLLPTPFNYAPSVSVLGAFVFPLFFFPFLITSVRVVVITDAGIRPCSCCSPTPRPHLQRVYRTTLTSCLPRGFIRRLACSHVLYLPSLGHCLSHWQLILSCSLTRSTLATGSCVYKALCWRSILLSIYPFPPSFVFV
jgi:hypothetical protein